MKLYGLLGSILVGRLLRTLFLIGIMKAVGSIKVKGRVGKKRPPMSDKWEEAASRWKHVYENSSRWKERAKAASNLALFYEMKTQLKDAYDWAAKSYEIFNNKKGEDYNYTKMQRLYVEALGKRIRSDQKLNKQFGE